MILLACLSAGCDSSDESSATARFELPPNRFFSHVEIIGSRGTALGRFNKPRSLAVDTQDNCYVVDLTGRVQKFSPQGEYLLRWQMPETDLGKPKGMSCDRQGNILVIEPHYARVNHFSPEGRLLSQWGSSGTNLGQFTVPRAITASENGTLLTCEYSRIDRVQVFQAETKKFLFSFGRPGAAPGQFNRPEGIAVDSRGTIYVADSCNHRIQVFSAAGKWQANIGRPGTGPGELSYPYDVVLDQSGHLFVCEFGNSRIQVFDSRYRSIEIIGRLGMAPGQFHNPWSIAFDSNGHLYVADGANHRVQKLIRRPSKHTSASTGSSFREGRSGS